MTEIDYEDLLNKLTIYIPEYSDFALYHQINNYGKENHISKYQDNKTNSKITNHIGDLMIKYGYLENNFDGVSTTLTEIGRLAKNKGGHFKYQEWIRNKDENIGLTIINAEQVNYVNENNSKVTQSSSIKKSKNPNKTAKSILVCIVGGLIVWVITNYLIIPWIYN